MTETHGPPVTVLVLDALANNGAVHITVDLARRWASAGATLAVVQHPGPTPELTVPDQVRLVSLARTSGRLRNRLPGVLRRSIWLARRSDVVLNGSEIGIGLLVSYVAARVANRPLVIAAHADIDQAMAEWISTRQQPVYRFIHRRADAAICIADAVVEPLVRNGLPRDRITVVRNGISLDAVRAKTGGPGNLVRVGVPTVVTTGRLAHQKGYDILLRAHARLVEQRPHRILFLNDGPERAELGRLAQELGIAGTVDFAGMVAAPLPSVASATVFCLPSRHEGLPLALLEAVSLGVPCIATDCSAGVREALADGRVGDLIPVEDVDALTAALADVLADPTRLRAKAARGPEHARSFDVEQMAAGWAGALSDAVNRGRRKRRQQ
ncbi:MAG: glycosyltransferase [Microlunatus sp.]|nr:glycosyltransferase [Microlunatus sp.]